MIYLDTSVLVSAFRTDDFSDATLDWLATNPPFILSHWTLTEFSSAVGILMRQNYVSNADRMTVETDLDGWLKGRPLCDVSGDDVRAARALVRDSETLRAGDALHLAVVVRHRLSLATFDRGMAAEAQRLGLEVVRP